MFATGTSCLALVWVIGRRRVPLPPERTSPFSAGVTRARVPPACATIGDVNRDDWMRRRTYRGADYDPGRLAGEARRPA